MCYYNSVLNGGYEMTNKDRYIITIVILIVCVVGGVIFFMRGKPADTGASVGQEISESGTAGVSYGFRYPDRLTEHFRKHGSEVGASSEADFLAKANAVIKNQAALHKLEAEDNDHVYFVEATGEIVFLSQDGYIRTYFISDRAYFERQGADAAA